MTMASTRPRLHHIALTVTAVEVDLTRYDGQGRCGDYAARAAVSCWMVASYSAGLR
jgi:hypothetical protein